eukprot:gene1117-652_t
MAKERLTFKINNRSVVYEGYVEHRPKDLMEVLAKLDVEEGTVVDTFRENIDDNSKFDDDEIRSMFVSAKAARAEKRARQQGRAEAPPVPTADAGAHASRHVDANAGVTKQEEEKVRITLTFQGQNFSYMGYPSAKKNAVLQLMVKKRDVLTYPLAIKTFRDNLPDLQLSDEEVVGEISSAIEAKTGEPPSFAAPQEEEEEPADEQEVAVLRNAIHQYNAIPKEEHDEIRGFIRQVLENPEEEIIPAQQRPARQISPQQSVPSSSREAEMGEEQSLDRSVNQQQFNQQYRAAGGRVAVYCQEKGDKTNTTKIIYSSPDVTFEEFKAMVAKKYGRDMALSFEEGSDIVEIDDDDVLGMFFELQQNNKKLKLFCSKSRKVVPTTNDSRTVSEQNENAVRPLVKAQAYSTGDLEVVLEKTFVGHKEAVYSCAFSLIGDRFVSASRDKSVRVWTINGKSEPVIMKGGHNGFALSCDFSPMGTRVISSSEDHLVKIWNTRTCSKSSSLKGHSDKVYCVEYSPNGDYITSCSCDATVRVWNTETFAKEATLKGHQLAVFSCGFSKADGGMRIVSGSDDRTIKIWKWEAGKEERTLRGHTGTIWSVAFSHNDKHIVSGSMDGELRVWEVDNGNCVHVFKAHEAPVHHAIFSSNDKYFLSCAKDGMVKIWRTEDAELTESIVAHEKTIYHMSLRSEHLLTSSLDNTLKLWKIKNFLYFIHYYPFIQAIHLHFESAQSHHSDQAKTFTGGKTKREIRKSSSRWIRTNDLLTRCRLRQGGLETASDKQRQPLPSAPLVADPEGSKASGGVAVFSRIIDSSIYGDYLSNRLIISRKLKSSKIKSRNINHCIDVSIISVLCSVLMVSIDEKNVSVMIQIHKTDTIDCEFCLFYLQFSYLFIIVLIFYSCIILEKRVFSISVLFHHFLCFWFEEPFIRIHIDTYVILSYKQQLSIIFHCLCLMGFSQIPRIYIYIYIFGFVFRDRLLVYTLSPVFQNYHYDGYSAFNKALGGDLLQFYFHALTDYYFTILSASQCRSSSCCDLLNLEYVFSSYPFILPISTISLKFKCQNYTRIFMLFDTIDDGNFCMPDIVKRYRVPYIPVLFLSHALGKESLSIQLYIDTCSSFGVFQHRRVYLFLTGFSALDFSRVSPQAKEN